MANIIKGNDLALYAVTGGIERKVCYAKGGSININADLKEIFGRGLGNWRDFIPGKKSYTVSVDGNLNAVPGNATAFIQALLDGTPIVWKMTDEVNVEWSGTVLVNSGTIEAPMDAYATFSNGFTGKGRLNFNILPTANTTGTASPAVTPAPVSNVFEPFQEELVFTYDGTNNVQNISFVPKFIGPAILNTLDLNPNTDYYYQNATIVIAPSQLVQGIEYHLQLYYFK